MRLVAMNAIHHVGGCKAAADCKATNRNSLSDSAFNNVPSSSHRENQIFLREFNATIVCHAETQNDIANNRNLARCVLI